MIELNIFREQRERVLQSLQKRHVSDAEEMVAQTIALDDKRKALQAQYDDMKAEFNSSSKKIGQLFQAGKAEEANAMKAQMGDMKEALKQLEEEQKINKEALEAQLLNIPNVLHENVVAGKGEEDNEIFKDHEGPLPELSVDALSHWDLAKQYQLFDLELGVKITGSGFPVFTGKGARLQRALIQFFLDRASAKGYTEVVPPLLVNEDTARATGQLPDKEGQMYHVTKDDLYLIPTAEVPLTNIYRDVILEEEQFPIKICGYTPCFRREAGSYGADVKGLNRVHQFDKVEIVQIQKPDASYDTLSEMKAHVAALLEDLQLPYRILRLCGGDTGFTAAMTYDFEVYSAAQKRWLEVSSVSNFETFQANRLKLRYRTEKGTALAHTLNGSALALARIIAALLENGQGPEGVRIPKALVPYTGFELIERP
jgi:seryl-tRNA synthetase